MPTQTLQGSDHFFNAMGFLGLQTSSGSINSVIKPALEDYFPSSSTQDSQNELRGSLYNFAVIKTDGSSDSDASRTQMGTIVDKLKDSTSGLTDFATYLNKRTGKFSRVITQMNNAADNVARVDILKTAIGVPGYSEESPVIQNG
jgi:hypothetical protein